MLVIISTVAVAMTILKYEWFSTPIYLKTGFDIIVETGIDINTDKPSLIM
jgi:hypothetical protein